MVRRREDIEGLRARIEALTPHGQIRLLDKVLTPARELRLVAERLHRKVRKVSPRTLDRAIDRAAREVRAERAGRAS
jgi:hypothetical protein